MALVGKDRIGPREGGPGTPSARPQPGALAKQSPFLQARTFPLPPPGVPILFNRIQNPACLSHRPLHKTIVMGAESYEITCKTTSRPGDYVVLGPLVIPVKGKHSDQVSPMRTQKVLMYPPPHGPSALQDTSQPPQTSGAQKCPTIQ